MMPPDLGGFEKVTALVIGDVMLDRYLWGRVSRISPEAPVPVVKVESRTYRLGGAANCSGQPGRPWLPCAPSGDQRN